MTSLSTAAHWSATVDGSGSGPSSASALSSAGSLLNWKLNVGLDPSAFLERFGSKKSAGCGKS